MEGTRKNLILLVLYFTFIPLSFGQSIVSDITSPVSSDIDPELFSEVVKIISNSKKIFILTNNAQKLDKGDFISLLIDQNLAARALVAKVTPDRVGIKILKIYSLANWQKLATNREVQILRGDDSYYYKKKTAEAKATPDVSGNDDISSVRIDSEEDLFNDKVLVDDLNIEDNNKRVIKPDNLLSASYGSITGVNISGSDENYDHWSIQWAYQFNDNFWVEGIYGISFLKRFPDPEINTNLYNITARLKYAIAAPFYSYLMPYVGYKFLSTDSPDAGQLNNAGTNNPDRELFLIGQLEQKAGIVYGITALRRLVPGWFVRLDLGTDLINFGFTIEF